MFERVVYRNLCTRCGTCAGVCPTNNISIGAPLGSALPVKGDDCTACGNCLESCPGERVDFIPFENSLFPDQASHPLLGVTDKIYMAYARDPEIRRGGASGGVTTALQLYLLDNHIVEGSFLYGKKDDEPWLGGGLIAESREEIIAAAQSRYHLSPMNSALWRLEEKAGRYAYVGLPCQVHGFRKLIGTEWNTDAVISPVIGIYCGNNLYFEATRVMMKKLGVTSLDDVAALSYREGTWPGNFSVTTKSGTTRRISKLDFNQAIPFYINHRCLTCIDLTNELTDISVGDGWAKESEGEKGWSIVLARSETGDAIVRGAADAGAIHIEEITVEEAAAMHSHAFDLKKKGAFIRLRLWKKWRIAVPGYDRPIPRFTAGRNIAEVFVSLQFILCSSRVGRAIFGVLPLGALGAVFRSIRKIWMKQSK